MALVTELEKVEPSRYAEHTKVECTYFIFDVDGEKYLQMDTCGSATRKFKGDKSQSLRFSPEAIEQLKDILKEF